MSELREQSVRDVDAALARAADRVRDWLDSRLDDDAANITRLYRGARDRLLYRLRMVYEGFLKDEPSITKARSGVAHYIDSSIDITVRELADYVGQTSVAQMSTMLSDAPATLSRLMARTPFADMPYAAQRVLDELTTTTVGGGTFWDHMLHTTDILKADITRNVRSALVHGSDFDTLRKSLLRTFGVDKLAEPKSNAYGAVKVYKNAARRQWNKLMGKVAREEGGVLVWWVTLDDRTTPGCAVRHGVPIEQLGESPPRHFNCRCTAAVFESTSGLSTYRQQGTAWLQAHGYTRRAAQAEESGWAWGRDTLVPVARVRETASRFHEYASVSRRDLPSLVIQPNHAAWRRNLEAVVTAANSDHVLLRRSSLRDPHVFVEGGWRPLRPQVGEVMIETARGLVADSPRITPAWDVHADVRAVVACFVDGKVWAIRPSDHRDIWVLPGGHVEPGEDLRAAAEREMREETGVPVRILKLLGTLRRGLLTTSAVFLAEQTGAQVAPETPDEIAEAALVDIDRLVPDHVAFIRSYVHDGDLRDQRGIHPRDTFHEAFDPEQHPRGEHGKFKPRDASKWAPGKGDVQTHTFSGGFLSDENGVEYYVKSGADEGHLRTEFLAGSLYRAAGIASPPGELVTRNGTLHYASQRVAGATRVDPRALPDHPDIKAGFAVDAWLGARDVAGMDHSNLLKDSSGRIQRIDTAGTLDRRAQGGTKAFGSTADEINTLRDPNINATSARMFSRMSSKELHDSIARVTNFSDKQIADHVRSAGFNAAQTATLTKTLIARRDNLAQLAQTRTSEAFDTKQHPRQPAGSSKGGEFAPKGTGGGAGDAGGGDNAAGKSAGDAKIGDKVHFVDPWDGAEYSGEVIAKPTGGLTVQVGGNDTGFAKSANLSWVTQINNQPIGKSAPGKKQKGAWRDPAKPIAATKTPPKKFGPDDPMFQFGQTALGPDDLEAKVRGKLVGKLGGESPIVRTDFKDDWDGWPDSQGGRLIRAAASDMWGGDAFMGADSPTFGSGAAAYSWLAKQYATGYNTPAAREGMQGYIKALYGLTQKKLAEDGQRTLTLYRGLSFKEAKSSTWHEGDRVEFTTGSVSSFSTDQKKTADKFGKYTVRVRVRMQSILSYYKSGPGTSGEKEYLLIGDHTKFFAHVTRSPNGKRSRQAEAEAETPTHVINLDEDDDNRNWLHILRRRKTQEAWDAKKHPRVPAGGVHGGQFTSGQPLVSVTRKPFFDRGGDPVPIDNWLNKFQTGALAERVALSFLRRTSKFRDAKFANIRRKNYPIDIVADGFAIEVKAGLCSNQKGSRQWRLTQGEPSAADKQTIAAMSATQRMKYGSAKDTQIMVRKERALRELSREHGIRLKPMTITAIVNPDTKRIDLYRFGGLHKRIGWNDKTLDVGKSFVASVKYKGPNVIPATKTKTSEAERAELTTLTDEQRAWWRDAIDSGVPMKLILHTQQDIDEYLDDWKQAIIQIKGK